MRDFPNKEGSSKPVNITRYPFKKWVQFSFNRPVAPHHKARYSEQPKRSKSKDWYFQDKWKHYCNPKVQIKNVTQLFNNPSIFDEFTDHQINQGLYYIAFGSDLPDHLADASIPLSLRKACIQSMESLYQNIFEKRDIQDAAYMWWDWFEGVPRNWTKDPLTKEGKELQKTMFNALSKTLQLKSERCQKGALHGLNHLKHPKTKAIIQSYLRRNKKLSPWLREYAKKCQHFKAI